MGCTASRPSNRVAEDSEADLWVAGRSKSKTAHLQTKYAEPFVPNRRYHAAVAQQVQTRQVSHTSGQNSLKRRNAGKAQVPARESSMHSEADVRSTATNPQVEDLDAFVVPGMSGHGRDSQRMTGREQMLLNVVHTRKQFAGTPRGQRRRAACVRCEHVCTPACTRIVSCCSAQRLKCPRRPRRPAASLAETAEGGSWNAARRALRDTEADAQGPAMDSHVARKDEFTYGGAYWADRMLDHGRKMRNICF
ncbi:unnamed protein product [Pedinophyceae sp. YPF-701]|nr:unnamed protein product [Pedinophyceae sp. YPF-701]